MSLCGLQGKGETWETELSSCLLVLTQGIVRSGDGHVWEVGCRRFVFPVLLQVFGWLTLSLHCFSLLVVSFSPLLLKNLYYLF